MNRQIVVIAHNIRSAHNVGSIMRTCEGIGVAKLFLSGYTPYPAAPNDSRMPHVAKKNDEKIAKIALGAEKLLDWQYEGDIVYLIEKLRNDGYKIVGLEQTIKSVPLPSINTKEGKLCLIEGNEVNGLDNSVLNQLDMIVEIPMLGKKESFNVVQALAMTLYKLTFE